MPKIAQINNIKIYIYTREHLPAHFHVEWAEYKVSVFIENFEILGKIPIKEKRIIRKWYKEVGKEFLLSKFYLYNPKLRK